MLPLNGKAHTIIHPVLQQGDLYCPQKKPALHVQKINSVLSTPAYNEKEKSNHVHFTGSKTELSTYYAYCADTQNQFMLLDVLVEV